MSLKVSRLCDRFVTHMAGVGLLTAVEHHVSLKVSRLCDRFVTHLAGVICVKTVEIYVHNFLIS